MTRLVVARVIGLRIERKRGVKAGEGLVGRAKPLFRQSAPDQSFGIVGVQGERPLVAGDGLFGALGQQLQIAAIVPGLRRMRIGAKRGVEIIVRLRVAAERRQGRAAIVEGAGIARRAGQRASVGGDSLLQPIEASAGGRRDRCKASR